MLWRGGCCTPVTRHNLCLRRKVPWVDAQANLLPQRRGAGVCSEVEEEQEKEARELESGRRDTDTGSGDVRC